MMLCRAGAAASIIALQKQHGAARAASWLAAPRRSRGITRRARSSLPLRLILRRAYIIAAHLLLRHNAYAYSIRAPRTDSAPPRHHAAHAAAENGSGVMAKWRYQ
jgi:hypothetical protein